ncbi:hypothetical protein [Amycolatopsis benzoatilytica]|uniref:hypothetical protein n=1 Tax=Amycolatopsis benzoatilytica TaxID=346045 RepID=UPI00037FBB83|nr:hypothetical protein [Amycolatopsis benzoatilytica]
MNFNPGPSRILGALALSVAVAGGVLATPANAAQAADPTPQQVLRSCGSAKWCKFHPKGSLIPFLGPAQYIGYHENCSSSEATKVFRKNVSSTTTDRYNIEIGVEAGLEGVLKASVRASFGQEWSTTDETTHEVRQNIGPKKRVDLWAVKHKTRVTGDWEMWHEKQWNGHNQWYVWDDVVEGQLSGAEWSSKSSEQAARC